MADAPDLGSGVVRRKGSSPFTRTNSGRISSCWFCLFSLSPQNLVSLTSFCPHHQSISNPHILPHRCCRRCNPKNSLFFHILIHPHRISLFSKFISILFSITIDILRKQVYTIGTSYTAQRHSTEMVFLRRNAL